MKVLTNVEDFKIEISDVLHLFFSKSFSMKNHLILKHNLEIKENSIINKVYLGYKNERVDEICLAEATYISQTQINQNKMNEIQKNQTELHSTENLRNSVKLAVYKLISSFFNKKFSWGILTKENLMQFAKNLIKTDDDLIFLEENLVDNFAVEPKKAELISKILRTQKSLIKNENLVNLYINIGGGANNNFINFAINDFQEIDDTQIGDIQINAQTDNVQAINTQVNDIQEINNLQKVNDIQEINNLQKVNDIQEIDSVQEKINFNAIFPKYFEALLKEIKTVKKIISQKSFVVKAIYIGGNIALLNTNELDILLQELAYPVSEFTVECSSPQLLTKSKLQILKK